MTTENLKINLPPRPEPAKPSPAILHARMYSILAAIGKLEGMAIAQPALYHALVDLEIEVRGAHDLLRDYLA